MKVLIAIDGSEFSDSVVETCCQTFINANDTSVKLISVFEQPLMAMSAPYAIPVEPSLSIEHDLRMEAEKVVVKAERQIRQRIPNLKHNLTTGVLRGSPARAIVDEAKDWDADLIVVGSHGYGFLERVLLGSVSGSVLHHAPCSVLVVKKKEATDRL
jgi:nucleotide-binding universal stress UspA family protein